MRTIFLLFTIAIFCHPNLFSQKKTGGTLERIAELAPTIRETSALIYWNNGFWTLNDSGNPPFLYQLDTSSGKILRAVHIENGVNVDWECLTQDEAFLYIGDTGDNRKQRSHKKIYRVSKAAMQEDSVKKVMADTFSFVFPYAGGVNEKYNVEAMVFSEGKLHLFSKEQDTTRHFTLLPRINTFQTAVYVDLFPAGGEITDACYDSSGNALYLLTSTLLVRKSIWKIGTGADLSLEGEKKLLPLGSAIQYGQLEAIGMKGRDFFLTGEGVMGIPPLCWKWVVPADL